MALRFDSPLIPTLNRLERFHAQLDELRRHVAARSVQADAYRQKLATTFGEVEPDLDALGVPRRVAIFNNEYPIFETVLHMGASDGVVKTCTDHAIQEVGKAIGRLRRLIEKGHYSIPPLSDGRHTLSPRQRRWASAIAGASAAVVFSGALINIATTNGWSGIVEKPFQSVGLLILAIVFAVIAAAIGRR